MDKFDNHKIPSIIGGTHDIQFPPIEFGPCPSIVVCDDWSNIKTDTSEMVSGTPFPPSTNTKAPILISIDWPKEPPKISCVVVVNSSIPIFPKPPMLSCVCLAESPGSTWREVAKKKEELRIINLEDKCKAIVHGLAEILQASDWTPFEGQGKITNESSDPNFRIFVDKLYDLFVRDADA